MLILNVFSSFAPLALIDPVIPRTVNVVIFFAVLFFLLRNPIKTFFAERFARIRSVLERAAKEKQEAQERIKAIDARLAQLDTEVAKIKETARQETAAELDRIKAQTDAELAKLRDTAQREIATAKQNAMVELRQFAAHNAVTMAEQLIRKELTVADDAALLQRVSSELKM